MHQTVDTTSWSAPEAPRPPQYPPPTPQGKTSGFAIASFVFGLIGGVILSVVFGIIALRRISRRGLRGRNDRAVLCVAIFPSPRRGGL